MGTDANNEKHGFLRDVATALLVIATLLVALTVSSRILRPKSNRSVYGLFDCASSGVTAEPDDSLDMLFIGDSLVLNACVPLEMWHDYGFASFNLTSLAQKLPETNTMLRLGTSNQHPKIIVFETQPLFKKCTVDHALMCEAQRIFPVLRYHNNWRALTLSDFTTTPQPTFHSQSRGSRVEPVTQALDDETQEVYMAPTEGTADIKWFNSWYFEQMVAYCRSLGATPVLISIPCPNEWDSARHNAMVAWAEEHDVAFYDFNLLCDEIGIDWTTDSKDGGEHLNKSGALKFSRYLGALLDERYDLPDHRGDEAYALWDTDYDSMHN